MYGKRNMETDIIICKIYSQWEFAVWLRKLKQGLFITLERWDGEGNGREFQKGGDICMPMADICTLWLYICISSVQLLSCVRLFVTP